MNQARMLYRSSCIRCLDSRHGIPYDGFYDLMALGRALGYSGDVEFIEGISIGRGGVFYIDDGEYDDGGDDDGEDDVREAIKKFLDDNTFPTGPR